MTLLQLEIFIAIHESGSFTKAAESLSMSQSAVSHALQTLENELDLALFERNKRDVRITEAGLSFLPHAREALNQTRIIEQKALNLKKLDSGKVKIGCFPSFTSHLLPELLVTFRNTYPNIEYLIMEGDYSEIASWVKNGAVDIGFSINPRDGAVFHRLFDDPLYVLMAPHHRLSGQSSLTAEDLSGEPYINVSGYEQLLEAVTKNSPRLLNITYHLHNTFSILSIVRAGLGITISPKLAIPPDAEGIHAVPLAPPFNRSVGCLIRSVATLTPAARAFAELCQASFQDVQPSSCPVGKRL